MFVKVKAHGVTRFVKSQNIDLLDILKKADDFEVELDENGEIKLYTGAEVGAILTPVSNVKVDLAATLGVKKSTRKSSK